MQRGPVSNPGAGREERPNRAERSTGPSQNRAADRQRGENERPRADRNDANRKQAEQARERDNDRKQAQQKQDRDQNRAQAERNRDQDRKQAEQERRNERKQAEQDRNDDRKQAEQDRERNRKQAEQDRGNDRKQGEDRKQAEQDQDRNRKQADQGRDNGQRFADRQEIRQARERLAREERQRLHSAFDVRRARVNVNFDVHVGRHVPRRVRLWSVPTTVVSFFPYYRGYSYFVVGDEICIVNPATYEIVDIIDVDYRRGAPVQQARLTLSDAEIGLVRRSIRRDHPVADVRLRLALGADIPNRVELHRFPRQVRNRIDKLDGYRFVLFEDEIVIVNARNREIALVIDRR